MYKCKSKQAGVGLNKSVGITYSLTLARLFASERIGEDEISRKTSVYYKQAGIVYEKLSITILG